MRGMGYPSTWTDVLDDNGNKIPKCNKDKEIIYNKDGSVRYLQKPDKQGIIDWIEDQKNWIHREMLTRYGWEREYKGSHPRGNLSTQDYRAARAAERLQEFERKIQQMQAEFDAHIEAQICKLDSSVDTVWRDSNSWDMVLHFLSSCSDDEYDRYVKRAREYLDTLPMREKEKAKMQLEKIMAEAAQKAREGKTQSTSKYKDQNSR